MCPQPIPKCCRHDVDKSVEVRGIEIVSALLRSDELLDASDPGIVLVVSRMFKMRWQISSLYNLCSE